MPPPDAAAFSQSCEIGHYETTEKKPLGGWGGVLGVARSAHRRVHSLPPGRRSPVFRVRSLSSEGGRSAAELPTNVQRHGRIEAGRPARFLPAMPAPWFPQPGLRGGTVSLWIGAGFLTHVFGGVARAGMSNMAARPPERCTGAPSYARTGGAAAYPPGWETFCC